MVIRLALLMLLALPATASARIGIGLTDGPGGAQALRHAAPFEYRYQYLAGGWPSWNPKGTFASMYARESFKAHVTPYEQARYLPIL